MCFLGCTSRYALLQTVALLSIWPTLKTAFCFACYLKQTTMSAPTSSILSPVAHLNNRHSRCLSTMSAIRSKGIDLSKTDTWMHKGPSRLRFRTQSKMHIAVSPMKLLVLHAIWRPIEIIGGDWAVSLLDLRVKVHFQILCHLCNTC